MAAVDRSQCTPIEYLYEASGGDGARDEIERRRIRASDADLIREAGRPMMWAMNRQESVALITGASGGIGYELAKLFARDHYNLVLVARSADKLNLVAAELQGQFGVTEDGCT
jgi:FlaA1/EpsC-like NDP-sugar epimerase